jgi:hypothetical protein
MRNNEERFGAAAQADPPASLVESANNSGILNFVVPTDFVDLPSKGLFYPEGHPLHEKDHIEIRQMTAKDEDILTSTSLLKKGVAIERLIENIIVDKTINISDLLVGDKNAIMIRARISAYGSVYEAMVQCPYCQANANHSFDLEEIAIKESQTDDSAKPTKIGTFIVELPSSKVKTEVRFLNGKDEANLLQYAEKKRKYNLVDSSVTDQMKAFIVSLNGIQDPGQIAEFVDNMPAKDSRYLRATYINLVPNIDLTQTIKCQSCFTEVEMEVPFTTDFFWPKQ